MPSAPLQTERGRLIPLALARWRETYTPAERALVAAINAAGPSYPGIRHWVLVGEEIVPAPLGDWCVQVERDPFAPGGRAVAYTLLGDGYVSTVFLGLDHGWDQSERPVLFETMTFYDHGLPAYHRMQWRTCTLAEARARHVTACFLVRTALATRRR